jgi:thiamine pyrophosphate-dependent acetolactate synthase large subunit-like protein
MSLGILPMVGALRPRKLVHCVLDNGVYGSTGNQASPAGHVRLDHVARAAGYPSVSAVTGTEAITEAVRTAVGSPGPHFLLVKVTAHEVPVPRIPHSPVAIRDRFRTAVARR